MATTSLASQIDALTNEATDDLVARAKARDARAALTARPRVLSRRRAPLVGLCVSLPVLGILLAINVFGISLTEQFTPPPSPQVARQQAQADLEDAVNGIDAFQADYSELPRTLVQVGAATRGEWTYTRKPDDHYQVIHAMFGQVVTFDSEQKRAGADEK